MEANNVFEGETGDAVGVSDLSQQACSVPDTAFS